MGEYKIPYEGEVYRYRDKVRGDRGAIDNAERKALALVRSLRKSGAENVKYREIVTSETPKRTGYISITFN